MGTTTSERVLTIRQPWADLIMAGQKDVENRTWPVPRTVGCDGCSGSTSLNGYDCPTCKGGEHGGRFRLWVHAAKLYDQWAWQHPAVPAHVRSYPTPEEADRYGALLGSVTVTGCHLADECRSCCSTDEPTEPVCFDADYCGTPALCSRWAEPDVWHWTLADPIPLDEPWPLKGRQGLWTLPDGMDELIHLERSA